MNYKTVQLLKSIGMNLNNLGFAVRIRFAHSEYIPYISYICGTSSRKSAGNYVKGCISFHQLNYLGRCAPSQHREVCSGGVLATEKGLIFNFIKRRGLGKGERD
jgi:hypothetical protein